MRCNRQVYRERTELLSARGVCTKQGEIPSTASVVDPGTKPGGDGTGERKPHPIDIILEKIQNIKRLTGAYRPITGDSGVTYTSDNTPIQFHYALVEQAGLIAGNDAAMQPNPEYPAELQPRDRTRGASALQVQEMRVLERNRRSAKTMTTAIADLPDKV